MPAVLLPGGCLGLVTGLSFVEARNVSLLWECERCFSDVGYPATST